MIIDLFFLGITFLLGCLLYLRLGRRTGTEKSPLMYAKRFMRSTKEEENVPQIAEVPFVVAIRQIQKLDKNFSLDGFLAFAQSSFETIITTYIKGNLEDLKNFLSKPMYDLYEKEKLAHAKKKLIGDLLFFRLISATINEIKIEKSIAEIQVWFVSEQTQVLKDSKEKIVEGDENSIDRISELWTFQRTITRKGDPWVLSAVGAHAEA